MISLKEHQIKMSPVLMLCFYSLKVWKDYVFPSRQTKQIDVWNYMWRVKAELWLKWRSWLLWRRGGAHTHTQLWGFCWVWEHAVLFRRIGHQADMLKSETAQSYSHWRSRVLYHREVLQFPKYTALGAFIYLFTQWLLFEIKRSKSRPDVKNSCELSITVLHKYCAFLLLEDYVKMRCHFSYLYWLNYFV